MTYSEKLKDPRWQKKRLEIMQRDEFACRNCGEDKDTLNVHHGYYERGLDPWEYPDDTLHTLCEKCHQEAQEADLVLRRLLGRMTDLYRVTGYVKGIAIDSYGLNEVRIFNAEDAGGMGDYLGVSDETIFRAVDKSGGAFNSQNLSEIDCLRRRFTEDIGRFCRGAHLPGVQQ